jgi:hypothetical protein
MLFRSTPVEAQSFTVRCPIPPHSSLHPTVSGTVSGRKTFGFHPPRHFRTTLFMYLHSIHIPLPDSKLSSTRIDCKQCQMSLLVPHTGAQSDRFTAAMEARNRCIRLYGYEDSHIHYCAKCTCFYPLGDSNGKPFEHMFGAP